MPSAYREVTSPRWFARREATAVAVLILLGLAVTAFVEIADEVLEGETRRLDQAVLLAMRTPGQPEDPLGPAWFEEVMRDFTAFGGLGVVVFVTVAVCGYLFFAQERGQALFVLVAVTGGALLSTALKSGFDRPRPDLVAHGMPTYQASFPSGHSMMSAVVYLTLGALLARLVNGRRRRAYIMGVAVVLVVTVGVSRVYLGVHWPSDVVAGWAAGISWAAACWLVALGLQHRRHA